MGAKRKDRWRKSGSGKIFRPEVEGVNIAGFRASKEGREDGEDNARQIDSGRVLEELEGFNCRHEGSLAIRGFFAFVL